MWNNNNFYFLWDVAIAGVNHSLEGNGGPDCVQVGVVIITYITMVQYIPMWQRILETLIIVPVAVCGIYWSLPDLIVPSNWQKHVKPLRRISLSAGAIAKGPLTDEEEDEEENNSRSSSEPQMHTNGVNHRSICHVKEEFVEEDEDTTRYSVLAAYSLVFGAELAYKIISKTLIYALNPCHVTTALQLMLLQMHSRKRRTCRIFRFHMYTMPGAILALAFPILNTRQLPGEVLIYFVQHVTILIVPLYLLHLEGAYTPEPIKNRGWPIFSFCVMLIYHFAFLQPIGLLTEVNLNCIVCPAVSDPFKTRVWRLFGVGHQFLAVLLVTKVYCWAGLVLTGWIRQLFKPSRHKKSE